MDTSDVYTQVFQSLMPLIQFAIVLWAAETILTMLIKEHRKSKKKKEREKRRLEYQDRRMANDEEHAKVTRAMRYDVLRRDGFKCVKCGRGARGRGEAPRRPYQARLTRGKVRNKQSADALRGLQLREGKQIRGVAYLLTKIEGGAHYCISPLFFYQFSPLSILLIVNHRNAASADCIEMRAAEYLSVGL